ncbi:MAG: hypothetical protein MPN21_11460 [Thermoanaerobaculia bacterium]|nr:hypothetical protein [Thermoanaerobaculia bacterium]
MSSIPDRNTRAWSHALLILLAICVALPSVADDTCSSIGKTSNTPGTFYARFCVDETDTASAIPTAVAATDGTAATAHTLDIWLDTGDYSTHPVSSMASLDFIGTLPQFITGYDFSPDGQTLYAINRSTNQFGTYGISAATFTSIGALTPPSGELWVSLVVDPVSGTIYGFSLDEVNQTGTLLTIDPATAAQTTVGTINADVLGASMNCDGEMFAISLFTDNLYQIDPATGNATLVGSLGIGLNFAQDIDFDNDTGILYHWAYEDGGDANYGTLDTTTGAFSLIDDLPSFELYIGAVRNSCDAAIFIDGFESGNTAAWDLATP